MRPGIDEARPSAPSDAAAERRRRRQRARARWLAVHRWAGLAAGAVFALLGLTGSLLVFYLEIDEWLHRPAIAAAQPAERASAPSTAYAHAPSDAQAPAHIDLDALMRVVRHAHPERTGPWRIEWPLADDRPLRLRYYRPAERSDRLFSPLLVVVDPGARAITRAGFWGDDPMTWVYDLHYSLQLDRHGRTAAGLLGLLLCASLVSGLYLWRPSVRRIRAAVPPTLRPGRVRTTYDLHVHAGVYGWLLLLALAATGSLLALPSWVQPWLSSSASGHAPPTAMPAPDGASHAAPDITRAAAASLDELVRRARQAFPDAEVRWIETSGAAGEPVSVRLRQPFEPSRRFPRTQVWFDAHDGGIVRLRDARLDPPGERVLAWLHPLHNGEAFGLGGRWIVFFCGLLPAVLFLTGVARYRHKQRQ